MGVNKITLNTPTGEEILIDLTGDTVTPDVLRKGYTAHDKTGTAIVGTFEGVAENLDAVLTEQEELIAELQDVLKGKAVGGGGQVGGLSQYAKFIAKPATANSLVIENPLGGIARKVCVQRTITDVTSSRKIQQYIVDTDLGIGVMNLVATDGGAMYGTKPYVSGSSNGKFAVEDGSVTLYRFNSANAWDSASEYEVEIWQ